LCSFDGFGGVFWDEHRAMNERVMCCWMERFEPQGAGLKGMQRRRSRLPVADAR
jgi:hypothetical protein